MPNPYVNKVVQSNGTALIDISDTTAVAADVASSKFFYLATGEKVEGTAETGGSSGYTRTAVVPEQTVTPATQGSQCLASLAQPHGILIAGDEYIITLNGDEYWYTCQNMWSTFNIIGDINYVWSGSDAQPYPCAIYDGNDFANLTLLTHNGNAGTSMTIKVEKIELTGGGGGGSSTLIAKTITANGTYSASDDSADGYSSVTVNVPSSGSSAWTKVAETSYQVSTTGTSAATVATWATGHSELWTSDKIVYVRIRDTAGKRAGYFYGSDTFFINHGMANKTSASSYANGVRQIFYVNTDGDYGTYAVGGTSGYGVYPDTFYSDGRIRIRRRYNGNYSLTINSTYKVEVYLLDPAGGVPIFE